MSIFSQNMDEFEKLVQTLEIVLTLISKYRQLSWINEFYSLTCMGNANVRDSTCLLYVSLNKSYKKEIKRKIIVIISLAIYIVAVTPLQFIYIYIYIYMCVCVIGKGVLLDSCV